MNPLKELSRLVGTAPVKAHVASVDGGMMTVATDSGPVRIAYVVGIKEGDDVTIQNNQAVKTPQIKSTEVFDV